MVKGAQTRHRQRPQKMARRGTNMVILAEHKAFARSFDSLFIEGMGLIDKVHDFFGHPGRVKAFCSKTENTIIPETAAFYERERKKLGTAILQMAAWLGLERAWREGDMSAENAAREKKKLHFSVPQPIVEEDKDPFAALPRDFRLLYTEVRHFIGRIQFMDKETKSCFVENRQKSGNAVNRQWQRLRRTFGKTAAK